MKIRINEEVKFKRIDSCFYTTEDGKIRLLHEYGRWEVYGLKGEKNPYIIFRTLNDAKAYVRKRLEDKQGEYW